MKGDLLVAVDTDSTNTTKGGNTSSKSHGGTPARRAEVKDVTPMFGAVVGGEQQAMESKPQPPAEPAADTQTTTTTTTNASSSSSSSSKEKHGRAHAGLERADTVVTPSMADCVVMYGGVDLVGNMHNDCLFLRLPPPQ